MIPTPRNVISVAFPALDEGHFTSSREVALVGPDGKSSFTPEGVRNNAKTIYKIQMLAQGFAGRAK